MDHMKLRVGRSGGGDPDVHYQMTPRGKGHALKLVSPVVLIGAEIRGREDRSGGKPS